MEGVYVAALIALAVALAWPVPRLLPRFTPGRDVPAATIALWQCVSLAGVLAGLLAAPLAVLLYARARSGQHDPSPWQHLPVLVAGLTISGILLVRLLIRGHKVGTALRRSRRDHSTLVDLIGLEPSADERLVGHPVRVLDHPTPTAYCVPGGTHRVVLTQGTLDALDAEQLGAVLAHERAHLRHRHDLVLEFFTVLHTAVPARVRSTAGLDEVKLLIELLADKWAAASSGKRPLATAMLALAEGSHPDAALGAGDDAVVRIERLAYGSDRPWLRVGVIAAAVAVLQLPVLLAVAAIVN